MIPTQKKTPEEIAALRDALAFPEPLIEPSQEDESETDLTQPPQSAAERRKKHHTLRKVELPLLPAELVTSKTTLPRQRHSVQELKKIQAKEAMEVFQNRSAIDPIAHLKKLTAHPLLLTPTYIIAFSAGLAVWKRNYFITPISLLCVSGLLTAYIFWKKKRSRHHAAILMIILVMTLIFGAIHYAPFFAPYFSYAT